MRKEYVLKEENNSKNQSNKKEEKQEKAKVVSGSSKSKGYLLFGTKTCPNCEIAKKKLSDSHITYEFIDAEEMPDLTQKYDVMAAPTLIKLNDEGFDKVVNASNIINFIDKETKL